MSLRVAVTRDEGPNGELSLALRSRGLEPVPCAAISRHDAPDGGRLKEAAQALGDYDWLIVASARAVDALLAARGGAPLPRHLRTAAVGDRTAARLVAAGANAPVVAEEAGARSLVAALEPLGPWSGRRCLLPRALDGGTTLGETLRAWGASVDEVVAYRTEPRAPQEIAAAWRAAAPEAVVVASPSAASALVTALGDQAFRKLRAVVAMGPTTREALASHGVGALTPEHSDFESIAELLRALALETGEDSR